MATKTTPATPDIAALRAAVEAAERELARECAAHAAIQERWTQLATALSQHDDAGSLTAAARRAARREAETLQEAYDAQADVVASAREAADRARSARKDAECQQVDDERRQIINRIVPTLPSLQSDIGRLAELEQLHPTGDGIGFFLAALQPSDRTRESGLTQWLRACAVLGYLSDENRAKYAPVVVNPYAEPASEPELPRAVALAVEEAVPAPEFGGLVVADDGSRAWSESAKV